MIERDTMLLFILFSSFGVLPNTQSKRFWEDTRVVGHSVGYYKIVNSSTFTLPNVLIPKVLITLNLWTLFGAQDGSQTKLLVEEYIYLYTHLHHRLSCKGFWRLMALWLCLKVNQTVFNIGNKRHSSYHSVSQVGCPRSWSPGEGSGAHLSGAAL